MKINKIIFSSSEEFSPFWNLQSFIWKEIFNIEPVCLLWGKVKNTNMSDKYGTIIEKTYNPDLVKSFQLTWSKFFHTSSEPETTWIIGDMDLYPLQKDFFINTIENLHEDFYTHLASNVVTNQTYEEKGGYLPAYYHIAKGKTFDRALSLSETSFEEQIKNIINDGRFTYKNEVSQEKIVSMFGSQSGNKVLIDENEYLYWLTDERYTSYKIFDSHKKGIINFKTVVNYQIVPYESPHQTRIDRASFNNGNYNNFNRLFLINNRLIDIHCFRPFEQQKKSLYTIIEQCFKKQITI
jgi:hypothetical protein